MLPDELPKQNFIQNGLRSNYYKTTTDLDSKSTRFESKKNSFSKRIIRQRRQLSATLPPFYTGLFETDDGNLSYIDYQLPFDIYWFSQKRKTVIAPPPSQPSNQNKKKKLYEPKQKQPLPIQRNTQTMNVLSSEINDNNQQKIMNKDLLKMEELTPHEKEIVLETSIFLKRNLRKIKEKRELKDKNNNPQKQQIDEQPLPLFFAQNYYHPNITNETKSSKEFSHLSHKGNYFQESMQKQ